MRLLPLEIGSLRLDWTRPYVVGVLNVTPDSFSDGGTVRSVQEAAAQARALADAGADIIDIGGESTRPAAAAVSEAEELARVLPVVEAVAAELDARGVGVSVDTTKAEVARRAAGAGAHLINDISGGAFEPAIVDVVAEAGVGYVLGHARGASIAEIHTRENESPGYEEVAFELAGRVARLPLVVRERTIVDPGIGFGKRGAANLELLARAGELATALRCPVMVGPSRKRFITERTGPDLGARDAGTVGAGLAAVAAGAHLIRVHNVGMFSHALRLYRAIVERGT